VGPFAGVSVFGLDALSSAGYGPEAALTILIPLGVAGLQFSLPITIAVHQFWPSSISVIAKQSLPIQMEQELTLWRRKI